MWDEKKYCISPYLFLTVINLVESFLSSFYFLLQQCLPRDMKNLRCIVFVKRIVTAIVICYLLNELLPELTGWSTEYTAGNNSRFRSQSRKEQNKIVDDFRNGTVSLFVYVFVVYHLGFREMFLFFLTCHSGCYFNPMFLAS